MKSLEYEPPSPQTMLERSNDEFITINNIEWGVGDELIHFLDRCCKKWARVPRLLSGIVAREGTHFTSTLYFIRSPSSSVMGS